MGDVIKLFDEQGRSRIDWSEVNAPNSAHNGLVSWKFATFALSRRRRRLLAAVAGDPGVGTLSICAQGRQEAMVFEAKNYGTNLGYMKADQASTFGKTRYWR